MLDHLPRLLTLAQRMLGDPVEAEDVAQEAFVRLWRQAGSWQPEARVGTWLYRVAHNLCIDQIRKQRRFSGDPVPELPDPGPGPSALRHSRELGQQVEAALAQLPERQRTAITLVHHQELSNIEAADIMGVSVEAMESLLSRGRRTLRQQLAGLKSDVKEMSDGA